MLFFLGQGFRVIAHDRRGMAAPPRPAVAMTWIITRRPSGDDAHLDLKGAVHDGHSTGGGEVVHYLARHGESRVAKA